MCGILTEIIIQSKRVITPLRVLWPCVVCTLWCVLCLPLAVETDQEAATDDEEQGVGLNLSSEEEGGWDMLHVQNL